MLIHIQSGKGGKDRYVPLAPSPPPAPCPLAHPPPSRLALSGPLEQTAATRCRCRLAGSRLPLQPPLAECGIPEACHRAYPAPLLGDPSAGSWRQPAPDPGLARARLAQHHRALHPPDAARREAQATAGDQPAAGGHTVITLGRSSGAMGQPTARSSASAFRPASARPWRRLSSAAPKRLGGHVYTCPRCATTRYSYHSCRNRHCPTCQHGQAQTWLAKQQELLLPVPYFW